MKVSIAEIKKAVVNAGGEFKKANFTYNGNAVYIVNGVKMTRQHMTNLYFACEL